MTLNITVVSQSGIHQSADFRISRTEKGTDGKWVELQPNSSKIVQLQYQKWFGFITYCGIGLWNGKRTDEYAVEWLADPATDMAFRDVVERIRERGSKWIGEINRARTEPFGHSFVIAGFEDGVAIYAIVSNVQSLTDRFRSISKELVSEIRMTKDLHLLITGIPEAVTEKSRSRLKAVVRSGSAPNVIRHEMAEVNRIASESTEAKNGISPACLTFSIDQHGAGHGEVHGDVQGPMVPRTVMHGIDINKMLVEVLKSTPGAKLVQASYATTQSNKAEIQEIIECQPQFNGIESCTVEEIGAMNRFWLSLQAINDRESIVGQVIDPFNTPFHAFIHTPDHQIRNLGTFGGPSSHAFAINEKNQIVGSADVNQQVTHAFLWDEPSGMHDLGTLGGKRSVACDINNLGQVVGESFVNAGEPENGGERAFLWSANDGMINLGDSFESWSRATAINNHGVVIGWRNRGSLVCGFVWSRERGATDIVGLNGRAFYPCAINDDGVVVAEGDDSAGRRRTFTWTLDGGLKQLAVPDDFHPSDLDPHGNVLGNVHSRPWQQPGVFNTVSDRYFEIPAAYNHQTSVKAINRKGVIIGEARTGSFKHQHPLIWRLSRA